MDEARTAAIDNRPSAAAIRRLAAESPDLGHGESVWMVGGGLPWAPPMSFTASPSATPDWRLKETAGKSPWCVTANGAVARRTG
jgi:hypothetical protein